MNGPARRLLAAVALAALASTALTGAAQARPGHGHGHGHDRDLGRETIAANDGWAATDGGTTGGSAADDAHVFKVDTWDELQTAIKGDESKIVYVDGDLDAMTDDQGNALSCTDFNDPGYSWETYLETYDPEVWGPNEASGPVEDARKRSYNAFRQHILLSPGSNTTIVGLGDSSLTHGSFFITGVENIIVRNLGVHDAYDCFPSWEGDSWDAQFDNFEISASTHVWLDHLTVTDGDAATNDYASPVIWEHKVERFDGGIDVVRASDLVTLSWNHIDTHDKTMLIGNTDSTNYDEADKLRVTVHHNWFETTSQRSPRLRWGQAHVYNNYFTYDAESGYPYFYSLGAGKESAIYAENNAWDMPGVDPALAIGNYGGTGIHVEGSEFNGEEIDLLAAYNEANPTKSLSGEVAELPAVHGKIHDTDEVAELVMRRSGAGNCR
ncbi:pectate lyase family protein [Glycomyces buryatensis]|uniref:Pectate lyase domain-containing protein n=1 Tax=Glycomyces buryatensis TaxID=2570927 RepID=A0A4S8Q1D0_9ACTN|nr:hypothetical protein [Glycomyces buryatensis]THV33904.1 hypothetical protein FAB82_24725 [Glycomyces buryatensis]